jgi:hypothetical protein
MIRLIDSIAHYKPVYYRRIVPGTVVGSSIFLFSAFPRADLMGGMTKC